MDAEDGHRHGRFQKKIAVERWAVTVRRYSESWGIKNSEHAHGPVLVHFLHSR
jgi:hypothetical protein